MSIEAVLQPRFHHAMSYFSFDAEVLFAFFAFGDTSGKIPQNIRQNFATFQQRLAKFQYNFNEISVIIIY